MPEISRQWLNSWKRYRLTIVFGLVYLLLTLFAMMHFMNSSYLGERYFKTNFDGMYHGTIHQPFVYRQLIFSVTRAVVMVSPDALQQAAEQAVLAVQTDPGLETLRSTLPWIDRAFPHSSPAYPRVVAVLLIYGCLWGYVWALMRLAREIFPGNSAIAYFSPVFGLLLISSFSWPFQYVYDIPVLFLSTACYYCIAAQRWKSYMAFFLLACWNKETAIFIFFFSAIWGFNHINRKTYINLMTAQYVIYALVRIWLLYLYSDNTGEYLKNHLFRVLPNDVFTTSQYSRILMVAWAFFLLTYQWTQKPAFLKCSLWLLPPMYVAYLVYGMPGEYRVFFDVLPLTLLLGMHTLIEVSGVSRSPVFSQETYLQPHSNIEKDSL